MQPEVIPTISARELADWMQQRPDLVLLDVREPPEVAAARIRDPRVVYAPLSRLASAPEPALPPEAMDPEATIVVFCHLGMRSAQVTWWLRQIGWKRVYNLSGGIDAYAQDVDRSVGMY